MLETLVRKALGSAYALRSVRLTLQLERGDPHLIQVSVRCASAQVAEDVQAIGQIMCGEELWRVYREINRPSDAGPRWWETLGDPLLNAAQMLHWLIPYVAAA